MTTYEEAAEKAVQGSWKSSPWLNSDQNDASRSAYAADVGRVLTDAGLPALIEENERLRAERDEFKRLFGECHPVHLDGVQRARVAESQRDAETARADRLADAIREARDIVRPGASVPLGVSEARHVDRLLAESHRILTAALQDTTPDTKEH
ncbi:MAG: hypothetical protein CMH36_10030 [Microbacterium sp.]|uniref:Uncharacterized protein n=1 Tax=Microbacterium ginsengisoli TaxID=400772 RepID=A0A3C1KH97_9MICO|nr:hypothetical protein [Microbacterium sp. 4NA327F11]MAL07147.1 hypothetical protein [Microbacterium sp.]MCK9917242.1 hypothetical protein [Microbacteriaceae bacterium K1510]HAN25818.1 hypothetical protein [Microbacterium ginsengisoli]|tara:strand:- start:178 stop:633 length:456 start_codon:yes stop_codon:yes gene_type:complete